MKRALVVFILLFSSSLASAQFLEKVEVRVVNVDVTVTDRDGQPVSGLTKDDFTILEDGKPQAISHFQAIEKTVSQTKAADAAPAAPASDDPRFRRKVLVIVDNLNIRPRDRNEALKNLEQFVDEHFGGDYDWSIAMAGRHVNMVLPLTSDKKSVHAAINAIRRSIGGQSVASQLPQHGVTTNQSNERMLESAFSAIGPISTEPTTSRDKFREPVSRREKMMFAEDSRNTILEATRAFATLEGRKIILLITGRLPFGDFELASEDGVYNRGTNTDAGRMASFRNDIVREANASNVSLYILAAGGLKAPGGAAMEDADWSVNRNNENVMYWLARQTGGALLGGNKIEQSFTRFDKLSSNYYSLGYSPSAAEDGQQHKIEVRLRDRKGYTLQYRDGYSTLSPRLQLERAMHSRAGAAMQSGPIDVTISTTAAQGDRRTALVPLRASVPAGQLQLITDATGTRGRVNIYVSVFEENGKHITTAMIPQEISLDKNRPSPSRFAFDLPKIQVKHGKYEVVIAVRDEVGETIGVSTTKIDV